MEYLLSFLASCLGFITFHPFFSMSAFVIMAIIIASLNLKRLTKILFLKKFLPFAGLIYILLFLNFFAGRDIMFRIIDSMGVKNTGIMGESRITDDVYNARTLYEYDIYIYRNPEKDENDMVKITFDDMFLPYYGEFAGEINRLPPPGTKVPIKHLPYNHRYFIILTDTTNEFISGELCAKYFHEYENKKSIFLSAKNVPSAMEFYNALNLIIRKNCLKNDTLRLHQFSDELKQVKDFISKNK